MIGRTPNQINKRQVISGCTGSKIDCVRRSEQVVDAPVNAARRRSFFRRNAWLFSLSRLGRSDGARPSVTSPDGSSSAQANLHR